MYEVIEMKTGTRKGIYKNRSLALKAAIRFNNEIGGVRYTHREI